MLDTILKLAVGYIICKVLSGGGDFLESIFHHVSLPSGGPQPTPEPIPTRVNFPVNDPTGIPWPSGWKATHPTSDVVNRAWALLPQLQLGERKVEMGPSGKWLTYYKSKNPSTGKTGVTVFEPRAALPSPSSMQPVPS